MDIQSIIPVGKRLIAEKVKVEEQKTAGGLYITDTAEETVVKMKVRYVSDEIELDIVAGDFILCGRFAGGEILLNEEKLKVIEEDEVIAIVDRSE